LLLAMAGYDLTARDFVSATWLALALALVAAGIRLPDKALRLAGLILLTATILKVFLLDAAELRGPASDPLVPGPRNRPDRDGEALRHRASRRAQGARIGLTGS
jgi:uncharacterized protein YjeT (DUF2065 family)